MSDETTPSEMAKKTVLYTLPGMDEVEVRRDLPFLEDGDGPRLLDLYRPTGGGGEGALPVVILVAGYPDPGMRRFVGCSFKETGSSVSWARLMAASGMAAIVYRNVVPAPDLQALLAFVREKGSSLGLDPARVGLWASSGNGPLAVAALLREWKSSARCAALLYGYLMDLDGETGVTDLSRQFGFVHPSAGKSMVDLDPEVPILLARAGQEQFPHLNEGIDRFVASSLGANRPLTLVNHPEGPHAFDLLHDSPRTREIVRQTLDFLHFHLVR
jgi:hypothetical protein